MSVRISEQRWAAVFVTVAKVVLTVAMHLLRKVRVLLHRIDRMILHEAIDPNYARHGLLVSVEQQSHRLHPMAAET